MKLYTVSAITDYKDYKGIQFQFFVENRKNPIIKYKKGIKGYKTISKEWQKYAEDLFDEYFTKSEVKELTRYLEEKHDIKNTALTIKEVQLPIDATRCLPIGAIPVGGMTDFYMLSKEDGYNLSVPIWAYFDLRHETKPAGQNYFGEIRNLIVSLEEEAEGLSQLINTIKDAIKGGEVEGLRAAYKAVDEYKHGSHFNEEDVPF
jgi:hypothetical protein